MLALDAILPRLRSDETGAETGVIFGGVVNHRLADRQFCVFVDLVSTLTTFQDEPPLPILMLRAKQGNH
jgi:hypothetical protein